MKSFLFALVFFITSLFLSLANSNDIDIPIVILATVMGFVTGKVSDLKSELQSLRASLAKDWEQRRSTEQEAIQSTDRGYSSSSSNLAESAVELKAQVASVDLSLHKSMTPEPELDSTISQLPNDTVSESQTWQKNKAEYSNQDQSTFNDLDTEELPIDRASAVIKNYFTGGNLFVRVGIIILFFGVSFLLKYVSEQGMLPIEYRLIGVTVASIAALLMGWRLRDKNPTYALLIQGAGIGILYLVIYAAFSMYHLLPALPAFMLLFVVSMLSAALAVLQNSKSLAVLGFSGGFLAPVLASSGSGNHVGLFSYYAVLNVAIVSIAWFKAWRSLNLFGFAFTFLIGTTWGVLSYSDNKFASTEPFLILFFLFYVLIAVLFALRQPPNLRGYVDGSLLFGVPLAASTLQYSLVKEYEYAVSLSAFAMGTFYLLLAWFIWKRAGNQLKLLAEAFLVLGVIFSSMAIPFALAPTQTVAAWGVEGLGLLWLGSRQRRLSVRIFGLLLQLGAGLIFVFSNSHVSNETAFINAVFISAMMMAISGIVSARLLDKPYADKQSWEKALSPFLLSWGLLWLFAGFGYQIETYYGDQWLPTSLLLLAAVCSLGFTLIAQKLQPQWRHAWVAASGLLAIMLLAFFTQFLTLGNSQIYHPFGLNGWLVWPVAFAVSYYLLYRLEKQQVLHSLQPAFHSLTLLLLLTLTTLEGGWQFDKVLNFENDWLSCWWIVPTTIAMWIIIKKRFWPFSIHHQTYQQQTGVVLSLFLSLWGIKALISAGNPIPLPWIPLLNPLDISLGFIVLTLFKWWQSIRDYFTFTTNRINEDNTQNQFNQQQLLIISIVGLIFIWLNFTLFRIAHHWFGTSYNMVALYNSGLVQAAVSILWTLFGVLLTVFANRKHFRDVWIAGAILLGLAVLKLFVIDLSELGSLARIISFLVVGLLLTSIGYFAPLPDKNDKTEMMNDEGNENRQDA